jgi:hypothetical protein
VVQINVAVQPLVKIAGFTRRQTFFNKLPKQSQTKAKLYTHDIWMVKTRKNAESAFDLFIKSYEL